MVVARILSNLYRHVADASWGAIGAIAASHAAVGWALMVAAGEPTLSNPGDYAWWHVVTASSTGYGDIYPATTAGRFVATMWVMAGGFPIFAAVLAKLGTTFIKGARARMEGRGDYGNMEGHLVVLGWRQVTTRRVVELFLSDRRYDHDGIVLVDATLDRNPIPTDARFVRAETLTAADGFRRAGLTRSEVIAVVGRDDSETLTVALAAWAACEADPAPGAPPRVVANFTDGAVAAILRAHCPTAEVSVLMPAETLVRAAQDAGSSEVLRQLLSPEDSPSQYSLAAPPEAEGVTYREALVSLKLFADATLVGVREATGRVLLNPPSELPLAAGMPLYLVASQRPLPEEAAEAFRKGAAMAAAARAAVSTTTT